MPCINATGLNGKSGERTGETRAFLFRKPQFRRLPPRLIFSFYSPILDCMPALPFPKSCVVCCKKCGHDVLTGTDSFPASSIHVVCSLCGEKRKYLPSEVIHGRPHFVVRKRASRRQAPLLISARARA
jgi:hypothetical protein